MMSKGLRETSLWGLVVIFFALSLLGPVIMLASKSLGETSAFQYYAEAFSDETLLNTIKNSVVVSCATAVSVTILGFLLAYGMHFTNISDKVKHWMEIGITLPMFLPTITYGFVIIYALGKQGLLTKLIGHQIFPIYGFSGLYLGYMIYTLPVVFLLLNDAFTYVDKKFVIVSKLMGDGFIRSFFNTVIRPMSGALGGAFLLSFVLSFTDFGIPASIGGTYKVIASELYHVMLGSIPDFNRGAVIAVLMLAPSVLGIVLLNYLERFNFHYDQLSHVELPANKMRDWVFKSLIWFVVGFFAVLFSVMFITPFVMNYPYDMSFTWKYVNKGLTSNNVKLVFRNSIMISTATAVFGTILSYTAAMIHQRCGLSFGKKKTLDFFATLTNSIPGMVLGLSYLFFFNKTDFKGTFAILIICNVVHFFTTPYLMGKNALSKMNPSWETIGSLMGDKWYETIMRVIVPNSKKTLVAMFSYYFIHSMITISAIIFLVTAKTAVLTSKIKELQHYANFNEIFILSILIFVTNITFKNVTKALEKRL